MSKLAIVTVLVTVLLALTGCGQKGDLYLPPEQPAQQQPEKQAKTEDETQE